MCTLYLLFLRSRISPWLANNETEETGDFFSADTTMRQFCLDALIFFSRFHLILNVTDVRSVCQLHPFFLLCHGKSNIKIVLHVPSKKGAHKTRLIGQNAT